MKLISLLDHCGQLFNIISKNNMPSDRLISNYLRSKKYIGSKERKFISELIFLTMRNLSLLENIYNILEAEQFKNTLEIKNCFKHSKNSFSILVLIQIIIAEDYPDIFYNLNINNILEKIKSQHSTIKETLINECQELGVSRNTISNYIENIHLTSKEHINSISKTSNFPDYLSFSPDFIDLLLNSQSLKNLFAQRSLAFDTSNIQNFLLSFNTPAFTCLRINSLHTTREQLATHLSEADISYFYGSLSPHSISLPNRHQLTILPAYKNGDFEIQDEASQLVAFCLNPMEEATILDACAGAGGKSLHIANLQKDKGRIIASDVEFMRLKEVKKRANLANLYSIETAMVDNDFNLKKLNKKQKNIASLFDYVLVDAPCTGSGTVRREPMKKYRITKKMVAKMAEKQLDILTNFSKKVKPGGVLLYSTCSVFAEENENIIKHFLGNNPGFMPEAIKPSFEENNIYIEDLAEDDFYITLYPFFHKTDGFFMAKMRKKQ